jgi:hypothetical protein
MNDTPESLEGAAHLSNLERPGGWTGEVTGLLGGNDRLPGVCPPGAFLEITEDGELF